MGFFKSSFSADIVPMYLNLFIKYYFHSAWYSDPVTAHPIFLWTFYGTMEFDAMDCWPFWGSVLRQAIDEGRHPFISSAMLLRSLFLPI